MFMDREKQRAETAPPRGPYRRAADRGSRGALSEARARVEILTPLTIELPDTGLPGSRETRRLQGRGDGALTTAACSAHCRSRSEAPNVIAIRGAKWLRQDHPAPPDQRRPRATRGRIRRLTDRIAMLDQHVSLLDPASSILDNMRHLNGDLTDNAAHAALARFAFRNKAALQIAGTLSGGELLRAGMACVFARPHRH